MKFRKKPVVVEASQWFKNGDHPDDYAKPFLDQKFGSCEVVTYSPEYQRQNDWSGQVVQRYRHPNVDGTNVCPHCNHTMHNHGWIDTLEGGHNVCPGDWIITGVKGERYPCKPDIFEATYEAVE
jgi:hypothetical protein